MFRNTLMVSTCSAGLVFGATAAGAAISVKEVRGFASPPALSNATGTGWLEGTTADEGYAAFELVQNTDAPGATGGITGGEAPPLGTTATEPLTEEVPGEAPAIGAGEGIEPSIGDITDEEPALGATEGIEPSIGDVGDEAPALGTTDRLDPSIGVTPERPAVGATGTQPSDEPLTGSGMTDPLSERTAPGSAITGERPATGTTGSRPSVGGGGASSSSTGTIE